MGGELNNREFLKLVSGLGRASATLTLKLAGTYQLKVALKGLVYEQY